MKFTSELSLKIRTAIKVKLAELGNDVYEELPDYIMIMVANKKSQEQMTEDLTLFLGDIAGQFTSWLHSLLSKLQSVSSDPATVKQQSDRPEKSASATPCDSGSEHNDYLPPDATCATPGSNEASTSYSSPRGEGGDHENGSTAADADSTSKPTKAASSDSDTGIKNDKDLQFNSDAPVQKRKLEHESRKIKVKARKVDSRSASDRSATTNVSSSRHKTEAESPKSKERDRKKHRSHAKKSSRKSPKSKTSGEVSSSVQHAELSESKESTKGRVMNYASQENVESTLSKSKINIRLKVKHNL